jgi:hypothetical protein
VLTKIYPSLPTSVQPISITKTLLIVPMSYDNLSSVSQNVLKFYQQLLVKRGGSLSFLVGTISNVLVMEIGWTDVGSEGYILVSTMCSQ